MQTIAERKVALRKQCERGIWCYSEEREQEVFERIDAIQTDADVDAWKAWMTAEFPENRMD